MRIDTAGNFWYTTEQDQTNVIFFNSIHTAFYSGNIGYIKSANPCSIEYIVRCLQ